MPLLIDESLFFLKHRIKKKNIQIEKRYDVDSTLFHGDEKLIQQLLINLILNAIQAVRQDGRITLGVKTLKKNGARKIHFEVEDNGAGIRDEDIDKIFDPFFTVRKEGGFGLGLFISKIIVEKHDGDIIINSKTSQGTVVAIDFPAGEPVDTVKSGDTDGGLLS
jgi:signal transduction histidine kinase